MSRVIMMQDLKNEKIDNIEWKYEGIKKDETSYPLKVWENLECILDKYNIKLSYNVVNKEIISSIEDSTTNSLLTDIHSLNLKEFLNLTREETANAMTRIAEKNKFNPFVELLKANENNDY